MKTAGLNKKNKAVFFIFVLFFWLAFSVFARSISETEASAVAAHWLLLRPAPLGTMLSGKIFAIKPLETATGEIMAYLIRFASGGFVVVSADRELEPILSFSAAGKVDRDSPLFSLLISDLTDRLKEIRLNKGENKGNKIQAAHRQEKWEILLGGKNFQAPRLEISDPRVDPLIQTSWNQTIAGGEACYNFYTPPFGDGEAANYPCGCAATALAQFLRFHRLPAKGVGRTTLTVAVDGKTRTLPLRGGNGMGGPYAWDKMPFRPGAGMTMEERRAIGALTFDAGLSAGMQYTSVESYGRLDLILDNLTKIFGFGHAHGGWTTWADNVHQPAGLKTMINPNLDAGLPVILGISVGIVRPSIAHIALCDGYGYDLFTSYHHLNLGWGGVGDIWYNLPDIETADRYDTVFACLYNIFPVGGGEIISGRITAGNGRPVKGARVVARRTGGGIYYAQTNARGIYALAKVPSGSNYVLTVETLPPRSVATGTSADYTQTSGNRWGIDFEAGQASVPAASWTRYQ